MVTEMMMFTDRFDRVWLRVTAYGGFRYKLLTPSEARGLGALASIATEVAFPDINTRISWLSSRTSPRLDQPT